MKKGFDIRVVSYEYIHSIKPKDFNALIKAVNPKPNDFILDGMCGYGAVGAGILKKEKKAIVYFLDESKVQIGRAKKYLTGVPNNRFVISVLPKSNFEANKFDTVVIKMGLHEVPLLEQLKVTKEVYRILKPDGKFVVWDIMLNTSTQKLFQDVIRKKDQLAGFKSLSKKRYFFREDEFLNTIKNAGFKRIKNYHTIQYRFSSIKRLESELDGDLGKLSQLNDYIEFRFPKNLRRPMAYKAAKDNIQFNITKKIFVMQK